MTTTVHKNLVVLARVLERLERSTVAVDPEQYRAVVQHLAAELEVAPRDIALETLLDAFPATAELYENLHFRHAGLCRSPLDEALSAEVDARSVIDKARRCAPQQKPASGS
ncbi:hypothetical protein [Ramlibacter albus]|uniref:Uncharacterized protein n=1 Tax=Ramlibacter albus TaxID=2079448 RepID=A0A923S4I9_9BURK|nr:hypothetical protein [Ramlibacter albus]MBC5764182.1 hypothetical protein [Ramlibacter albus]